MEARFVIFAVFAVVAQSSACSVTQYKLDTDLSLMKEAGNSTLENFYKIVNGFFDAIKDRRLNSGSNGDKIKEEITDAFTEAFDIIVDALSLLATNTAVLEENVVEKKAALRELIATVWSIFDVTPASVDSAQTQVEIDDITMDAAVQITIIWNNIFDMIRDSVNSDAPEINDAIQTLRAKVIPIVLQGAGAMISGMSIYVTKLATGFSEEEATLLEAIEMHRNLALVAKSAEVNEKYSLLQYMAAYNYLGAGINVTAHAELGNNELEVYYKLWDVFGRALDSLDNEDMTSSDFDDLQHNMYQSLYAAFAASVRSIRSISSDIPVKVNEVSAINAMASLTASIRVALQLVRMEGSSDISGLLKELQTGVDANTVFVWNIVYDTLKEISNDVDGARDAIDKVWNEAAPGLSTAIDVLFRAIRGQLSAEYPVEDAILGPVWRDLSKKFDIIRGLRIATFIRNEGLEADFSLLYNDQL